MEDIHIAKLASELNINQMCTFLDEGVQEWL